MKHKKTVNKKAVILAIIVILAAIAAVLPMTINQYKRTHPKWEDVELENEADIKTAYEMGIINGRSEVEYGKDEALCGAEVAYAVVKVYENKNDLANSFNKYKIENSEEYIEKAKEYKLWVEGMPTRDEFVTREDFGAAISEIIINDEALNDVKELPEADKLKYSDRVLTSYNRGVLLEPDAGQAYSPELQIKRGEAATLVLMCLEPQRRVKVTTPDYNGLEEKLKENMAGWKGDWSVYVGDYSTGTEISVNSHQVYSASLIKLYVAQAIYQKIADGELTETSRINDEVSKMITYSDNNAWKYLASTLGGGWYSGGMAKTTELAQASGFGDTGTFYQGNYRNFNFTSVNDCGEYLRRLLEGEIVNEEYSRRILELLKQQHVRHKIPAGVPEGITVANKTGELDYVSGDAAIIFAPKRTYILVIIGDNLVNGYADEKKLTELSKVVYEYMNV